MCFLFVGSRVERFAQADIDGQQGQPAVLLFLFRLARVNLKYLNGGTHVPKAYLLYTVVADSCPGNVQVPPMFDCSVPYATNVTLPRLAAN